MALTTSSRWFVNGDGEHVLELTIRIDKELSAIHRWSGATPLEAAHKVSCTDSPDCVDTGEQ